MVSTQERETLQLRSLKLRTAIKRTFGLFTLTLQLTPQAEQETQPRNLHKTWEGFFSQTLCTPYCYFWKSSASYYGCAGTWPSLPSSLTRVGKVKLTLVTGHG